MFLLVTDNEAEDPGTIVIKQEPPLGEMIATPSPAEDDSAPMKHEVSVTGSALVQTATILEEEECNDTNDKVG